MFVLSQCLVLSLLLSAEAGTRAAEQVGLIELHEALDHAVMSKIYAEDPDSMYVTLRGGGLSVFDVSDPSAPRLRSRWSEPVDVEGQDRRGDLLVVVERTGALRTFDVSDPDAPTPIGRVTLEVDRGAYRWFRERLMTRLGSGPFGALHTKLYDADDGHRYALVTATSTGELIAVDVTDPTQPTQVGAVQTGVRFIEGIYIHRDHAFVGGFGSDRLAVVEVSRPTELRLVETLEDSRYRQMVSEMSPAHPELLFTALWGDEGGLAIFDVHTPAQATPIGVLALPELRRSNRVKLSGTDALLPLEDHPGGFAVVDVSDPTRPSLSLLEVGIDGISAPYTLEVCGDYLYLFGSTAPRMAVFRLYESKP
ncbi:MAG: hypothetical protein ACI8S6_002469 [Myxococcota bacterium]|jgi:hypothetical protein